MDEDDSQDDELINRNTSQIKGKRAAVWDISDDSDDSDEAEDGESDGGEEEEEDSTNGEEEDGQNEEMKDEEDDEEDEDQDLEGEDNNFGEASADFVGMSSDDDSERCPICLNSFTRQPVATPENCEHYFCFDCILEWTKNATSCPVDRIDFGSIYLRKSYGGKVKKMVIVQKPVKEGREETVDLDLEQTSCEVCGDSGREDRLLLCDGCDAGYHMECLTPPLDSVPVEEWFCPECEANNRGSAEELSETSSRPSTARPATSRSRPPAAGPTRAIARTQQSERVRANVNRHRITQARTSELTPTYLIQSTWLDETINAVVEGLNTAVYIRDFTPRAPTSRRRRTAKRRKVKSKKTSAKGQTASKGVKRRKTRVKRRKSKKKLVVKKPATARSRIANNLRIVKPKNSSSLPTVYKPAEHTLSNMRADIGAASLSIYGDPFDLDPFVDREDDEHQTRVTSLLEAKRRGISHSALRSHQPVARPVTAGLSRRAVHVPQPAAVTESAPVPDLLGSILTGQSILLMDSSDVVINRDGSLKATKTTAPSALVQCSRTNSGSADSQSPGITLADSSFFNEDLPGSSHSSAERLLTPGAFSSPSSQPSSSSNAQTALHSDFSSKRNFHPNRSTSSAGRWETSGLRTPREATQSSIHSKQDSKQSHPVKAPTKPAWVDVLELPRIPKIKRESGDHGRGSGGVYSRPETGMKNHSGDKGRQRSVDQQKGRDDHQTKKRQSNEASSSSAFSNSFSSSFSSNYQQSASSSSAVSFRINSSGNSWSARRVSAASSSSFSNDIPQETSKKKEKQKQLNKAKEMLLASRTLTSTEDDNIYDPCNPTVSDSSSSDDEVGSSVQNATDEKKASTVANRDGSKKTRWDSVKVKTEKEESGTSQEETGSSQSILSHNVGFPALKTKDIKIEERIFINPEIKKEKIWDDAHESERFVKSDESHKNSQEAQPAATGSSLYKLKTESKKEESGEEAGTSNSSPFDNKDRSPQAGTPERKREDKKSDTSSKHLGHNKQWSRCSKEQQSSSSETDRSKKNDEASDRGAEKKEKDKDRRRAGSRERRRTESPSDSSADKTLKTRQRSRSQSKDRSRRRRSRSRSSSGSRDRSKKRKQRMDRENDKETDYDRGRQSKDKKLQSFSKSKSPSRSRSKDPKRDQSPPKLSSGSRERKEDPSKGHRPLLPSRDKVESKSKDKRRNRSRSRSRDRRKGESSSRSLQTASGKDVLNIGRCPDVKKEKSETKRKNVEVIKEESAVCSIDSQMKEEDGDSSAIRPVAETTETTEEINNPSEIKEEKLSSLDLFEEFLINKQLKTEETDTRFPPIEDFSGRIIKSEPSSSESRPLPLITPFPKLSTAVVTDSVRETHADQRSSAGPTAPIKQEPSDSDEDLSVDVMLDNLDYVKSEHVEKSELANQGEGEKVEGKNQEEQASGEAAAGKSKTQVKRVTWNIQEPEGPRPEKSPSKVALYKLKLKQEGIRRPSSANQVKALTRSTNNDQKSVLGSSNDPSKSAVGQRGDDSRSAGSHVKEFSSSATPAEGEDEHLSRNDKYLKKLHMQERAVEEVKLAIKPFYRGRVINKEEYKEILRKAVQKVCHSKSGEINPVKVGNLIKAYVDKYKHARKYKKEDSESVAQTEAAITAESP